MSEVFHGVPNLVTGSGGDRVYFARGVVGVANVGSKTYLHKFISTKNLNNLRMKNVNF